MGRQQDALWTFFYNFPRDTDGAAADQIGQAIGKNTMIIRSLADIYYYRYPQYVWAMEAAHIMHQTMANESRLRILDAPGGDGIMTYWLARNSPNLDFDLIDICQKQLSRAHKYITLQNVTILYQDIYQMQFKAKEQYVWLLINSLFIFPDIDTLLAKAYGNVKYIIGIFPYIHRINYRCFFRNHPNFTNPSAMNKQDTIAFFKKHNYELLDVRETTFIPFHCYFKSGLYSVALRLFNLLNDLYKEKGKGAYWLALLQRKEK